MGRIASRIARIGPWNAIGGAFFLVLITLAIAYVSAQIAERRDAAWHGIDRDAAACDDRPLRDTAVCLQDGRRYECLFDRGAFWCAEAAR